LCLQEFGDITNIEFWREKNDEEADWYCEVIVVNDRRTDKCFYFPVQRWVKPNHHYKIQEFATILPQFDPNRDDRQKELDEKRILYTYGQTAPDLPVQVCACRTDFLHLFDFFT
jgi:arachidonate 5-lipoxygenase